MTPVRGTPSLAASQLGITELLPSTRNGWRSNDRKRHGYYKLICSPNVRVTQREPSQGPSKDLGSAKRGPPGFDTSSHFAHLK